MLEENMLQANRLKMDQKKRAIEEARKKWYRLRFILWTKRIAIWGSTALLVLFPQIAGHWLGKFLGAMINEIIRCLHV